MMEVFAAVLLFGALTIGVVASSPALMLTPYILKNQTELARNLSAVDPSEVHQLRSYSGFLTVNETHNSNMFFWYFPVQDQKVTKNTPWIIWLQGGPGASSMAGLFLEIGPIMYDGEHLKLRQWSWNTKYPLLFIDNPVGAGYSFTGSTDGYVDNMDDCAEHLYSALQQFLEIFPEHREAPLYIAGESYAGHYIPAFAYRILHPKPTNIKLKNTTVNLQGLMLGNPMIDRRDEINMTSVYYNWGLIDSQGVEAVRPLQEQYAAAIRDHKDIEAYHLREKLLDRIEKRAYQLQSYNVLKDAMHLSGFISYVTSEPIKEAIHVGDKGFDFTDGIAYAKLIRDNFVSLTPKVEELLEHYRILIYCGQLDLTAPCVLNAEARRRTWKWKGRDAFLKAPRQPWWYNETLAGYVKSGGNFTEVLVRGAGHLSPMDKPAEVLNLISYFIRGINLPNPSNYREDENDSPPYPESTTTDTATAKQSQQKADIPKNTNKSSLITSIVLNVVFALVIIVGAVYWIKWKKRTDTYFYSMVDNASLSDGVLTMD